MNRLITRLALLFTPRTRHLTDAEIVGIIDGELASCDTSRCYRHIEACWYCRTRKERLESTICQYVQNREKRLAPFMPPPAAGEARFLARLQQARELHHRDAKRSGFRRAARAAVPAWITNTVGCACVRARLQALRKQMTQFDRIPSLQPAIGMVFLCVLLLATYAFLQHGVPRKPAVPTQPVTVTAQHVLEQTSATEKQLTGAAGQIAHRTITIREYSETGTPLSDRTVEIWRSTDKTARRLYKNQKLEATEIVTATGARGLHSKPGKPGSTEHRDSIDAADIWQLEPSTADFARLVNPERAHLQLTPVNYVLTYRQDSASSDGVIAADLVVRRTDMRPVEVYVMLREKGQVRQYQVSEVRFEKLNAKDAPPDLFALPLEHSLQPPLPALPLVAPPLSIRALEIDALYRLDLAGNSPGEQIEIERTPDGKLSIRGIVASQQRRAEIVQLLGTAVQDLAAELKLDVPGGSAAGESPGANSRDLAAPAAIDNRLRPYLSSGDLSKEQLPDASRKFRQGVVQDAALIAQHAWALKRLTALFTLDDLKDAGLPAYRQWLGMVDKHAKTIEQAAARTRLHLTPLFPDVDTEHPHVWVGDTQDISHTAVRILDLASANDEAIRVSFTPSARIEQGPGLENPQYWSGLTTLEKTTAALRKTVQQLEEELDESRR